MDYIMMQNQDFNLPYRLMGIIFLVLWILMGFITCEFEKTPLKSTITANFPAFLMLLFVMYQEIILKHYWSSIFGIATQFYYLPLVNIAIVFYPPFMTIRFWLVSLIGFILMFSSYYLGSYLKKHGNI
ncbi:hypothetical protein [Tissierella praeacuta]|uniref:hypothetical protein n=1 Tax=Tissierella praeacuta TaxID=43131 RepID=UPI00289B19B9|nr:hypothetical protein [Tissierella praeacuta]